MGSLPSWMLSVALRRRKVQSAQGGLARRRCMRSERRKRDVVSSGFKVTRWCMRCHHEPYAGNDKYNILVLNTVERRLDLYANEMNMPAQQVDPCDAAWFVLLSSSMSEGPSGHSLNQSDGILDAAWITLITSCFLLDYNLNSSFFRAIQLKSLRDWTSGGCDVITAAR
jgi:hypothetical protein